MKKSFSSFVLWLRKLRTNKRSLAVLIAVYGIMAIASNIVDWPWLTWVAEENWLVLPFAPICSLYPLLLAIWFINEYRGKKNPAWFTTFIFVGIVSYGIMSVIYFPVYMAWRGIELRTVGNMLWVLVYASQALSIASELKPLTWYAAAPVYGYFLFKDYSDRYLGSFIDTVQVNYPDAVKDILGITILAIHLVVIAAVIRQTNFKRRLTASPPYRLPT